MQHSCPQATHGKHLNLLPPAREVARHATHDKWRQQQENAEVICYLQPVFNL